jgi:hypothetical protein
MKVLGALVLCFVLGGCASMQQQSTLDSQFEAYRLALKEARERHEITPVQEQERLRDRYWKLYGRDPESVGHFAFSVALMQSAQSGAFPQNEADVLVSAKEKAVFAAKVESLRGPNSFEYPPDQAR